MAKFSRVSASKSLEGVWKTYEDPTGLELEVLLARIDGNPHYDSKLQALMIPHKKKMEKGKSISNTVARKIMNRALSEEILLDWKPTENFVGEDGKPIKYSSDEAFDLLEDDIDFKNWVEQTSGDVDSFLMSTD